MRVILWIVMLVVIGGLCYRRYKQGKFMAVAITIVSIVAAVYLGLSVLLFLMQSRVLYQPSRGYDYDPADYGLKYEAVALSTPDGESLAGWFVPAEAGGRTILFCHGNAGNISHRLDTLKMFHELGLNCLIVDYRGYGQSTGKPTEKGTLIDILAGFQWLIEEKGARPEQIILFGRSLGGSIAARIAADVHPAALVLESTFTSFDDVGAHYYPWLPVRWFSRFDYNTLKAVKQVGCPVLVIHSPDDEIIPYKFGQQIFVAANEPKQFAELKGTHNEGIYDSANLYKQIWQNWLDQLNG
ncbi:MAG: alpha/beta hydrolase [Planctomycetota bacterium]|nr:MAG: alpha/beta hydrolase [Planctomycetota bacterium]